MTGATTLLATLEGLADPAAGEGAARQSSA